MWKGIVYGLGACALWALIYLLPIWLPDYSSMEIALGRATIMGVAALVGLLWFHRQLVRSVNKKDWLYAARLSIVGNIIQPWFLFTSIEYAGVPLAATFFGLIPVSVAIIANERDRNKGKLHVPFKKLVLPLTILFLGLVLSNFEGLVDSIVHPSDAYGFGLGCLFAICSTVAWTWYPIRNADWLLEHPKVSPIFFTEMQGIVLLPLGLVLLLILFFIEPERGFLGPQPITFFLLMIMAGILCSYVATALWNAMSQRVPTAIVGPMLVTETVFSVAFSLVYEKTLPSLTLLGGLVLLIIGVVGTLLLFQKYSKKSE